MGISNEEGGQKIIREEAGDKKIMKKVVIKYSQTNSQFYLKI